MQAVDTVASSREEHRDERRRGAPDARGTLARAADEVKVVQDAIDGEGLRTMHVLSPGPLDEHWILTSPVVRDAEVQLYVDELKLHHLIVRWPAREAIRGFVRGAEHIEWPMMLWALKKGDKVSGQIKLAAEAHFATFAKWPELAWIRHLPRKTESGTAISMKHGDVILLEAEWVPKRCVCVGCGRQARIQAVEEVNYGE